MSRNHGLVVLMLLMSAAPALADFITDMAVFPVAARTMGRHGTRWVTDLTIYNPMAYRVTFEINFAEADQPNTQSTVRWVWQEIGPGETLMIEDVLQSLWGLENKAMGLLLVIVRPPHLPNPPGTKIHATTRIYNTGGDAGTYGQTVPSLVTTGNVGWGSSFVTGARNDDAYRSNLGIACMSFSVRAHYRITSAAGRVVARGFKDLMQVSMHQWSFDELGIGDIEGPLTVELWMDPDDGTPDPCAIEFPNAFFAYVSKVDNVSGDAEYLPAVPETPFICNGQ